MAAALVIAFSGSAPSGTDGADNQGAVRSGALSKAAPAKCPSARKAVHFYSRRLAEWRKKMGAASHNRVGIAQRCPRYLASVLKRRAALARRTYELRFVTLYEKWRCIHEHEGAWNANTGNGYWGGLQMDWGFMHTYGPEFIRRWGLAHRWPVWAQLIAAERAFHGFAGFGGRGYSPWGTRGMCGV